MEIEAKTILYYVLEKMGRERIESEIASTTSSIPRIASEIFSTCTTALRPYDYDKAKVHGDLAVALLHYLLAVCMIQAERKVEYDHGLILDVVIPSVRQLRTDPKRALLLVFPGKTDQGGISEQVRIAQKVQPQPANIWLIFGYYSEMVDSCEGFRRYVPDESARGVLRPFSSLIDDIRSFLEVNKIKSFKIFRT